MWARPTPQLSTWSASTMCDRSGARRAQLRGVWYHGASLRTPRRRRRQVTQQLELPDKLDVGLQKNRHGACIS